MGGQRFGAGQALNRLVQEAQLFGGEVLFLGQGAVLQRHFHIGEVLQLVQKPPVDLGDVVDSVVRHATLEGFVHAEGALGVLHMQMLDDFLGRELFKVGQGHCVQTQLGGGNRLHHGVFKAVADRHNLAGRHHLGTQRLVGVDELVKRPFGVFYNDVVQRRLKAGAGFAGDIVGDLVQRVAEGDLGGNLGDGIARCLGCQRGGARHTGVDLDDRVLEGVGL